MGRHWLLVCAVVAVALATDVEPEFLELARRRLSKVGVVFLEDDDAVNIQCCPVCNSTSESEPPGHRDNIASMAWGARNLISTQVNRGNI